MGAVDLVIQVESPKSVARGLQRIGRAGHELGADLEGPDLPEVPRRPARVGGRRRADARGRDRGDGDPEATRSTCSRSRSSRCAPTRRSRSVELHDLVRGAYPFADLSRVAARERARHALRSLSVRRVRRPEAAHRLGPHGRHDPRSRGRAAAGRHERGHDPRPRPFRRAPRQRRRAGRRARRGDGLRGESRSDVPARRVDVAHRGDHPRPA